jgi:hypothetical protein
MLTFGVLSEGDMSRLEIKIVVEPPFISMRTEHFGTGAGILGLELFKALVDYVRALNDVVTYKLPELLIQAGKLVVEANEAREFCMAEFGRLTIVEKAKAMKQMAENMKRLARVP